MTLLPNQYLGPVTYGLSCLRLSNFKCSKNSLWVQKFSRFYVVLLRILERPPMFVMYSVNSTECFYVWALRQLCAKVLQKEIDLLSSCIVLLSDEETSFTRGMFLIGL